MTRIDYHIATRVEDTESTCDPCLAGAAEAAGPTSPCDPAGRGIAAPAWGSVDAGACADA